MAYILSIVIVILACVPCADGAVDDNNSSNTISKKDITSDHPDTDACSPLCTCTCCSSFSVNITFLVSFSPVAKSLSPIESLYKEPQLKDFPCSIWQPPKIS